MNKKAIKDQEISLKLYDNKSWLTTINLKLKWKKFREEKTSELTNKKINTLITELCEGCFKKFQLFTIYLKNLKVFKMLWQ